MLTAIYTAFVEAFRNLRSNFFQTFLSVLGIIIGVGALVTMLALIDGLEQLARDSIADKSAMETVTVRKNTFRMVDGLRVQLDRTIDISQPLMDSMLADLPYPAASQLFATGTVLIDRPDTTEELAVRYTAVSLPLVEELDSVAYGRTLEAEDRERDVVVIGHTLARRLIGTSRDVVEAVGLRIAVFGQELEVVGVSPPTEDDILQTMLPLRVLDRADNGLTYSAAGLVNFARIEDVRPGKVFIDDWFAARFPAIEQPVQTLASLEMVENLELGFSLFRLVMSFLIGIAVVVGGVGVMNVLLMSITERTAEIGVRKAVGANRRRIVTQFLSESVAISVIGSVFGLLLGIVMALISAAAISYFAGFDFSAVFSGQTMAVVAVVAVLTGIVFGTYPARRAAALDPVRAIQRT
ncbi:Macrolide export ATP-binding/permease protein MacB [Neolewinella maritima]|uniref:Macrolide export ATP-binding/permease protein MacB n=1 Tax=Neolewinella maritima TaxID=1383882 RepID=A0ABN8F9Y6_9BACT|nr:ABC transporter permease [Neolewinella maritima]CAH1001566.1 Macrolide export ATP-binding/permease protein MacB [Neolewinella maritima]